MRLCFCGKPVVGAPQKRYCSFTCRNRMAEYRALDRAGPKRCKICRELFLPKRKGSKVCSAACKGKAISISKLSRRNPNWTGAKDARAEWDAALRTRCEICLSEDRLRNHHIIYQQHVRKRNGEEWDPRNAMTLCISCHSRHHNGTDFRILVCDLPREFWAFGKELLGDYLWDYLGRHYDTGNTGLKGLLSNA